MLIKRRSFIQSGTLAAASLFVPRMLKAFERPGTLPAGNKILIVLQLTGGNDGLNTFIPYRNDLYYRSRPRIGIKRDQALHLTDDMGINSALPFFKTLYDEGNLSILNSVGYPQPDRSHFRSMDIWHTASNSTEYLQTGWLGRYLDQQCASCEHPTQVLEIDEVLSLCLRGSSQNGIAFNDAARLYRSSKDPLLTKLVGSHQHEHSSHTVDYLYQTLAGTVNNASYIFQNSRQFPVSAGYPATGIGKDLKTIASLVLSDINTRVYYLSVGSFDTHAAQEPRQRKLFHELDEALSVFVADMKRHSRFDDILIAGFSEFGRRVEQNASGGTDHGAANSMFFIGGKIKKQGLLNDLPDLADLEDGDIRFKVDFRQVYATLLEHWLGVRSQTILNGTFTPLPFL